MSARSGPYVGRPIPRFEDLRLVRGAGRFTDDFAFPAQAYAVFVRSPHAHADIVGIDTERAAHSPGVVAVLTAADYVGDGHSGMRHMVQPTDAINPREPAFRYANDRRPFEQPQSPLAIDRVRYVGEPVAVVIGESAALASDAAGLVEVEYGVLPAVADINEALELDAPLVWDAAPNNLALDGEHGDRSATETALATSDIVVEREFRSQRIANAQLEPRAAIARCDADSCEMVAGSQGVVRQQAEIAASLGIPREQLRVVSPDVGGGFGPRSYVQAEQVVVAWAARRLQRPVRWTSDRSEAFVSDHQGRDSLARLRLGFDCDGRIQALAIDCVYNVGAHAVGGYVPIANFSRIATSVYAIPNAYIHVRAVLTNTGSTGPFRGAGRPEAMFMLERLLDLAAPRLGIDRVELRRRNLISHDQLPHRTPLGLTYDSGDFLGNMQRALKLADWEGFAVRRSEASKRGLLAGIGLANYIEAPVGAPFERVKATVQPDGYVEVVAGTQSSGQGHETSFAQVTADQLGITPSEVRLITGDTNHVTAGGGTHSDRSMRWAGALLVTACALIRDRGRELAAELLEVAPLDLEYVGGGWTATGTDRHVTLFEVSAAAAAESTPLAAEATFTGRMPAHPTGAAVCEVEIDPETGAVRITRYSAVDDVGQPINPLILHGQVAGGIVQGMGQALLEHLEYEPGSGQLVRGSFLDYAMPRASRLPNFAMELTEDPTSGNPLRIKGGGEAGITPSLAAVVNAIVDALGSFGIDHLDMPVTSQRVWAALESARERPQDLRRQRPA